MGYRTNGGLHKGTHGASKEKGGRRRFRAQVPFAKCPRLALPQSCVLTQGISPTADTHQKNGERGDFLNVTVTLAPAVLLVKESPQDRLGTGSFRI